MTPRQIAIAGGVLPGLIVISVALALGNLAWDALRPEEKPVAIVTRSRMPADTTTSIAPILALAPFGASEAATSANTGGPLTLHGVLLAEPAALSTALIGSASGAVLAYHLGERLPNGAVLVQILRREVVLQEDGAPVRLGFPHRDAEGAGRETDAVSSPPVEDHKPGAPVDNHAGVAAMRALLPDSVLHPDAPSARARADLRPEPR